MGFVVAFFVCKYFRVSCNHGSTRHFFFRRSTIFCFNSIRMDYMTACALHSRFIRTLIAITHYHLLLCDAQRSFFHYNFFSLSLPLNFRPNVSISRWFRQHLSIKTEKKQQVYVESSFTSGERNMEINSYIFSIIIIIFHAVWLLALLVASIRLCFFLFLFYIYTLANGQIQI